MHLHFITLPNTILQLIAMLSAICGWIVINFILIVYISVRRLGCGLEKRYVYVLGSVALLFFLGAVILTILGGSV